jgi:hypothetical protein
MADTLAWLWIVQQGGNQVTERTEGEELCLWI